MKRTNSFRMSEKENSGVYIYFVNYLVVFSLMFSLSDTVSRPEIEALYPTDTKVLESQPISFQCTLPSSIKMLVKWTWSCGSDTNRKPTTAGSSRSILRFYATKDDDKTQCSCRAESLSNETYNEMSNRLNIAVYYVPRDPPILVTSPKTPLVEGQKFNFRCDLKYPGNPPMIWTWRCGERTLVPSQFNNMGASSEITFEAESWQNGLSCLCIASSPRFGYNISSKGQSIAVLYAPLDFPVLINISNTHVDEDTPVTLRCHVTSGGNPPLFWSWYCGDMPMERGLSDGGNWSEVTFIATKMYHQRTCYCRLNSTSEKIKYDKRSQKILIFIKTEEIRFSVPVFASTTSILIGAVMIVSCILIYQTHRLREKRLPLKMLTCHCFENLCKSPAAREVSKKGPQGLM
ncbi:uncharacterized protein [Magallana gigas]|uniref:uncharacterized protein isoform X5 n=1 Tax=Magallana gigas TaxID=29159 RepID=UPI00334249F5